jgi:hypothetical protein
VYNAPPHNRATKDGMERLPKIIASTVVRSAHQGESHGGVYLIDLHTEAVKQVIRYDEPSISWEGRGGPRGLRGIAFYEDEIYLAASDEIFVYSKDFRFVRSIRNEYLRHCHETYLAGATLYVTSTGRDSVLKYDLRTRSFVKGYHVWFRGPKRQLNMMGFRVRGPGRRRGMMGLREAVGTLAPMPRLQTFDPNSDEGPPASSNTCHLNSVSYEGGLLTVAGTRCAHLLTINDSKVASYARIPYGTHNARPFGPRPQHLPDPQIYKPDDGRAKHHTRPGGLAFLASANQRRCALDGRLRDERVVRLRGEPRRPLWSSTSWAIIWL